MPPATSAAPAKRIAIVGAGLRGLASAVHLRRRGHLPTVFEKSDAIGGIWQRVYESSVANTPSFGYTFHYSNRWDGTVPTRRNVLDNLERMIDVEDLASSIRLSTPIRNVRRDERGAWMLESDVRDSDDRFSASEAFDAVLVCTGFLGAQRTPPETIASSYGGDVLLPYAFDPERLRERNVTVVGSGSTALEMVQLALERSASRVSLVVRPDTKFYDTATRSAFRYCVRSNPLMYFLPRLRGGRPAAACGGLRDTLADSRVEVYRLPLVSAGLGHVMTSDQQRLETDALVWCTGWHANVPNWARSFDEEPTLVVASCPRCLDTGGFGYGTSSAHAKALCAVLEHGFRRPFSSGSGHCDCHGGGLEYTRHIVLSLALYLGWEQRDSRALARLVRYGITSNLERYRLSHEPLFAKLVSFFNAPLGL